MVSFWCRTTWACHSIAAKYWVSCNSGRGSDGTHLQLTSAAYYLCGGNVNLCLYTSTTRAACQPQLILCVYTIIGMAPPNKSMYFTSSIPVQPVMMHFRNVDLDRHAQVPLIRGAIGLPNMQFLADGQCNWCFAYLMVGHSWADNTDIGWRIEFDHCWGNCENVVQRESHSVADHCLSQTLLKVRSWPNVDGKAVDPLNMEFSFYWGLLDFYREPAWLWSVVGIA